MSDDSLDALGVRIERLTLAPDDISAPLTRLLRPIYYRMGWQPRASVAVLRSLAAKMAAPVVADAADLWRLHARAVAELEDNIHQVERATVISRRPLVSQAAWLRRLYEVLVRAADALDALGDQADAPLMTRQDPASLLPPLALAGARSIEDVVVDAPDAADDPEPTVDPGRVLELQLDAVDELLAAARASGQQLARKRRLLEAARQLLLETSAALPVEPAGAQARLESIADGITSINRLQAAGVRGDVTLLHQARSALSRGERARLFAALQALERASHDRGDLQVARLTRRAIDRLTGGEVAPTLAATSRSAQAVLGDDIVDAVRAGYDDARAAAMGLPKGAVAGVITEVIRGYFAPGQERATLASALTVDGCFDVGGALTPVRVEEEYIERTRVRFPTQHLSLVPATSVEDVPGALIDDPRTVIMDLAAGRLLTRTYVREDIATRERTLMRGEVRVYVVDGSSSMIGPRARMRDSILVAELATMIRRLQSPKRDTRITLYFRYFNHELGPVTRVTNIAEALAAIRDLIATPRSGGTDIQAALIASLEQVQTAQEADPDLARAQIVLITDGEAEVTDARVDEARAAIGARPVGISVIALGQQNRALRRLVAGQRRGGERAFYHFLSDAYLKRVCLGDVDDGMPVVAPAVTLPRTDAERMASDEQVHAVLEEIAELERSRERTALRSLDETDRSRRLRDAPDVTVAGEGERAHVESHFGDDEAIARRFASWYPLPNRAPRAAATPEPGTREHDDLESVIVLCAAVVEVLEIVGRTARERRADAVELLERLLPDARLTPARYQEILRLFPTDVANALEAVHAVANEGVYWRMATPLAAQSR